MQTDLELYTVVETKAADGYILDETAHDVTLRYDDNAPDGLQRQSPKQTATVQSIMLQN